MFNTRRAIAALRSGEYGSGLFPLRLIAQRGRFLAASPVTTFAALLLPAGLLAQSGSYTLP